MAPCYNMEFGTSLMILMFSFYSSNPDNSPAMKSQLDIVWRKRHRNLRSGSSANRYGFFFSPVNTMTFARFAPEVSKVTCGLTRSWIYIQHSHFDLFAEQRTIPAELSVHVDITTNVELKVWTAPSFVIAAFCGRGNYSKFLFGLHKSP